MPTDPSVAQARAGRVRSAEFVRIGYGLHQASSSAGDLVVLLVAWSLVLPRAAVFTHVSAAALRDWWLPPLPADVPVFAAIRQGGETCGRREVRLSRHPEQPTSITVSGLSVTDVAETLLACARDLCLLDLIVLLDGVLHSDPTLRSTVEVVAARRRRGAPLLRRALALADHRSESPWESMLRVLLVVCGVSVEPQHELLAADGSFVARADLWLVGTTTILEYDGAVHLEKRQQRQDLRRARRVSGQQWTRHGYTAADVLHRAVTILRDVDAALGRDHDPSRVRAWHDLLRESARTSAGQVRLRGRFGLPPAAAGATVA